MLGAILLLWYLQHNCFIDQICSHKQIQMFIVLSYSLTIFMSQYIKTGERNPLLMKKSWKISNFFVVVVLFTFEKREKVNEKRLQSGSLFVVGCQNKLVIVSKTSNIPKGESKSSNSSSIGIFKNKNKNKMKTQPTARTGMRTFNWHWSSQQTKH